MPRSRPATVSSTRRRLRAGTALGTALALGIAIAPATTAQVWTGPQDGDWGDAANWAPATVPDAAGDAAVIEGPFAGETERGIVTLDGNSFTVGSLIATGDEGVRLRDGTLILDDPDPPIIAVDEGGLITDADLTLELATDSVIAVEPGSSATIEGTITGAGRLDKRLGGTLTLGGANTHAGTTVSAGTLVITNATALGTGTAILDGGTLLGGADLTVANNITFAADATGTLGAATGTTLTATGNITRGGNGSMVFGAPGETGTVVIAGTAFPSFGGISAGTTVATGTLRIGSADAGVLLLSPAVNPATQIDAGATLDLNGFDAFVRGLTGGGTVLSGNGAVTLTSLGTGNFAGTIGDAAHTVSLQVETGTLTLTGASTDIGTSTVVTGATLVIGNGGAVNAVTNNAGGTFTVQGGGAAGAVDNAGGGSNAGTIASLNNSGNFTNTNQITGNADSSGTLGNSGTIGGTLTVTGGTTTNSGTVEGSAAVSAGTLETSGSIDGNLTVSGTGAADNTGTIGGNALLQAGTLDNAGLIGGTLTVEGGAATNTGAGAQGVAGAASVSAGTLENTGRIGGTLTVSGTGAATNSGTIDGTTTLSAGTLTLNGGTYGEGITATGGTLEVTGTLQGTDSSIDNQTAMNVTADASLSGAALTNSGTITLSDGVTLDAGTIANTAGSITLGAGATLEGTANTLTNDALITVGTDGTVTDAGTITNTVTGTISFEGPGGTATLNSDAGTIDNAGTIQLTSGGLNINGNLGNTGTLSLAGGGTTTLTGNLQTSNTVTLADGSPLNITGNLTQTAGTLGLGTSTLTTTGNTLISGGSLTGTGGTLATATYRQTAGSVAADVTLEANAFVFDGAGNVTVDGVLADRTPGATLAQSGSGTTRLTGTNTYTGLTTVSAGTLEIAGSIAGDASVTGGTLSNETTGTISGNLSQSGGTVDNAGLIGGDAGITSGTLTNAPTGTISGGLVQGGGTVTNDGTISGSATVTAGDLTSGGTIGGDLALSNGTVVNSGDITGDANVASGTLTSSGTIGGTLDMGGGAVTNAGTVGGDAIVGSGALQTTGTITGGLQQAGGTVTNAGNIGGSATVSGGGLTSGGTIGGDLALSNGTVDNTGTITGGATVASGALTTAGSIGGPLQVDGGTAANTGTIGGDAAITDGVLETAGSIAGALQVGGGTATNTGSVGNTVTVAGGTLNITGGSYGGGISNTGGTLNAAGAMGGANSDIASANGMNVTGALNQGGGALNLTGGTLSLAADHTGIGTATLGSRVTTASTGIRPTFAAGTISGGPGAVIDLSLVDGGGGQELDIIGDLVGELTILYPTERLQGALATLTPVVSWDGLLPAGVDGVPGPLVLDFASADQFLLIGTTIPVLEVNAVTPTSGVSADGLPATGGLVSAFLTFDDPTRTFNLVTTANPALGGVAGTVATVESLIGTVINRPTGAFVGPPLFETDCIRGAWARGVGGRARGDSDTTVAGPNITVPSEVSVSYRGIQGGFDFGCYRAPEGWDIAAGITFGLNEGSSSQDVFNLNVNPITGVVTQGALASVTRGDFRQAYGGAYLAAARGDWFGEMQVRRERNRYTFTNTAVIAGGGLPLAAQRYTSDGTTVSASISRGIALPNGLSLTPTAGFGITRSSGGSLPFTDAGGTAFGRLDTESHTNRIVFVGAGLGRAEVADDGFSATNRFVSVNLYGDLSPSRKASFTQFGTGGAPDSTVQFSTARQGNFGELSVGVSHFRIIQTETGFNQLDLSLRGDLRFSRNVRTYGITAQARLQF